MREMGVGTRAARMLWALALAALLSCGAVLAATPQRAIAAPDSGLTFTVGTNGTETKSVAGYMLFSAVVDNDTNAASEVSWNGTYESAVKTFLNDGDNGADQTYSAWLDGGADTAESALAYISENIATSDHVAAPNGLNAPSTWSFATKLAVEVAKLEPTCAAQPVSSSASASFADLTEGFYLFYDATVPVMWTSVGGNASGATIKTPQYLAAQKAVRDNAGTAFGKIADAGFGQASTFRVTGEVPASVPAEDVSFKYDLHDTLPNGLTVDTSQVKVYAAVGDDLTEITGRFTVAFDSTNNELTATCASLYAQTGEGAGLLRSGTVTGIVFEYQATVNAQATYGTVYNENLAKIEYGAGDNAGTTTPEVTARVVSYRLRVVKVDSEEASSKLSGAQFTLKKNVDGSDQYVQSDGSLDTAEHFFTTNASGEVDVLHIDSGAYTLTEVKAPSNYELPSPAYAEITISPELDPDTGELTLLNATCSNEEAFSATATAANGLVVVTVKDAPAAVLPITGMTPNQLGTVVGALLVLAGVVALVVRGRRKAGSRA